MGVALVSRDAPGKEPRFCCWPNPLLADSSFCPSYSWGPASRNLSSDTSAVLPRSSLLHSSLAPEWIGGEGGARVSCRGYSVICAPPISKTMAVDSLEAELFLICGFRNTW